MIDANQARENKRRVESLLLSEALARRGVGPEARPTPECPPMATLVEIAAGRRAGSADQRRHIYGCDFCLGMIRRAQRQRPVLQWIVRRVAYPISWAACLIVGVLLGSLAFPTTHVGEAGRWSELGQVADIVADTRNHAAEQLRGQEGAGAEASINELRRENGRLENEIRSVVDTLGRVHLLLLEILQQGETTGRGEGSGAQDATPQAPFA